MTKISVSLILFFALFILQGPGQTEEQREVKLEDFSLVEKVQPADSEVKDGFDSIRREELQAYLKFISSDLMEGREAASRGYDVASEFAATMFSLWGIKPAGDSPRASQRFSFGPPRKEEKPQRSYFQEIDLKEVLKNTGKIVIEYRQGSQSKTQSFYPNIDYTYYARDTHSLTAPVVFVGYGISEKELKFDEYKGIDVTGKIVMMFTETPGKDDPKSPFQQKELKDKYAPPRRMMRHRLSPKVKLAKDKGAVAVLLVENSPEKNGDVATYILDSKKVDDEKPIFPTERRRLTLIEPLPAMPWETLPSIRISRQMAAEIVKMADLQLDDLAKKIDKDLKSQSRQLQGITLTLKSTAETRLVRSRNVLGYIEGSDPELKKEAVIIGAHLDHLGKKGDYIFNGADDNGSGSVAVMEIAQAFAANSVKPKRTVLFALWTGEEEGLLGSRFYTIHPFLPLKKTVAYINLDMVSREWKPDRLKRMARMWRMKIPDEVMEKIDVPNFVNLSLQAGNKTLYDALKNNNRYVGLSLHLRESKTAMGGSDHAPFGLNGIAWASFFGAMTDDYHQPSDSIEKISLNLLEKITRLTYLSAFTLANQ